MNWLMNCYCELEWTDLYILWIGITWVMFWNLIIILNEFSCKLDSEKIMKWIVHGLWTGVYDWIWLDYSINLQIYFAFCLKFKKLENCIELVWQERGKMKYWLRLKQQLDDVSIFLIHGPTCVHWPLFQYSNFPLFHYSCLLGRTLYQDGGRKFKYFSSQTKTCQDSPNRYCSSRSTAGSPLSQLQ